MDGTSTSPDDAGRGKGGGRGSGGARSDPGRGAYGPPAEPAAHATKRISTQAEALFGLLAARRGSGYEGRTLAQRRQEVDGMASVYPLPADVEHERVVVGGVPAEWLRPPGTSAGCLLYLHGGGYVRGSIASHRELAARIARSAGLRALIIDYRLAPESPYPAAVDDAERAYRWLVDQKDLAPGSIVLAGDSAGGGLCVSLLTRLAGRAPQMPAGAVLLSPWADLRRSSSAFAVDPDFDPMLTTGDFIFSAEAYLGDTPDDDPGPSPRLADLSGLPPLLLLVGQRELLFQDVLDLGEAAAQAGVDVQILVKSGMCHVWPLFADLPESADAIQVIGSFVRSVMPVAAPG